MIPNALAMLKKLNFIVKLPNNSTSFQKIILPNIFVLGIVFYDY